MMPSMTAQGERRTIHEGPQFDYEEVTLVGSDGKERTRQYVKHPGAVCICPVLEGEDGVEVIFIRNERFTVGKALLELPAGTLEEGEAVETCAARELIEETGYEAARIVPLGSFYTTPGMTDEVMHAFAATGLTHVGQRLEVAADHLGAGRRNVSGRARPAGRGQQLHCEMQCQRLTLGPTLTFPKHVRACENAQVRVAPNIYPALECVYCWHCSTSILASLASGDTKGWSGH